MNVVLTWADFFNEDFMQRKMTSQALFPQPSFTHAVICFIYFEINGNG